jgi:hypothetical protein
LRLVGIGERPVGVRDGSVEILGECEPTRQISSQAVANSFFPTASAASIRLAARTVSPVW